MSNEICECGHDKKYHHSGKGIYLKGCIQPLAIEIGCACLSFTARPDEPTELQIRFGNKFILGDGANERILQLQGKDFTAICEWFDAELAAERTRREEAEKVVDHYADESTWGHHSSGVDGENKRQYIAVCYEGEVNGNGYDKAREYRLKYPADTRDEEANENDCCSRPGNGHAFDCPKADVPRV